jgi:hypothetical protein
MQELNKVIQNWRNYTGYNKLTLLGEIRVSNKDSLSLLSLASEEKEEINQLVQKTSEKFPYMEIKVKHGLAETNINFYVYEKFVSEDNFLEKFRQGIADFVYWLTTEKNFLTRFTANGEFVNRKNKQKFVFLSKENMVEYKIIDSKPISFLESPVAHSITVYLCAVILLFLVLNTLYVLYFYVPDHNPDRLLRQIIFV